MVINIDRDNFKEEVENSSKPVLIDFYADWCGPCRQLSPLVDEISDEFTDIKVGKINIDNQPEIASAFGVMSIPTLVIIKNGEVLGTSLGAISKAKLVEFIKSNI